MTDFLSKFQEDGQLVSQGQFTISPRKALEKFGRHAFPRKTAWLTKFLQAVGDTCGLEASGTKSLPSLRESNYSFVIDAGGVESF